MTLFTFSKNKNKLEYFLQENCTLSLEEEFDIKGEKECRIGSRITNEE